MNRHVLSAVMMAILSLAMTANAQVIFSDGFEIDTVAGPAANPLVSGWLTDANQTGNGDGILQDDEHRVWIAPGSSGSSGIDSKGWICNVPGSFIYKDLGLAVAHTNYLATLFIDSESSLTNRSINYRVDLLKGSAYSTALPVASIGGNEPGGEDGKHPGEYKQLEYVSGAVAGTDHLFLRVKLISGSSWMFIDDAAVSIVEDFGNPPLWIFGFKANPTHVYPGAASTLSWTTSLVEDTLIIDPGNLDVLGVTSTNVNPSSNTVYTLIASNAHASATNTAEVTIITNQPAIQAFTSSDYIVNIGEPFILNWNVDDAVSLSINGVDYSTTNATAVSIFADTLFTLIATNPNGTSTGTVEVLVTATPPVINDFSSNFENVYTTGTVVTLSWDVDNEQELYLDGVDVTGLLSTDVTVHSNTTYTLIARNSFGDTTNTVDVSVAHMTVLWRRGWEQRGSVDITNDNLDGPAAGPVDIGAQDFTLVSGTARAWNGAGVGGYDIIATVAGTQSGLFDCVVEISNVVYSANQELTLDFVIGTGSSSGLTGDWFVEFGTIDGGTFTALPGVDAGSAGYQLAGTLTPSENFMDNVNPSFIFGYNVGGRLQQLTVDATDAVNGRNVAIRFGITGSDAWAGFSDMALSTPERTSPDEIGTIAINKLAGADMVISWGPTTIGQTYNVETNAHLEDPNWGLFESIIGDGGGITVTSSTTAAQLFYKVTSE